MDVPHLALMLVIPYCPVCGNPATWVDRPDGDLLAPLKCVCEQCHWSGSAPKFCHIPVALRKTEF